MALLFTEYDVHVARNAYVLHWNFSIARATSYSVNSQTTAYPVIKFIYLSCYMCNSRSLFDIDTFCESSGLGWMSPDRRHNPT